MKRRSFIAALGSAAAFRSDAAFAQTAGLPVVGFLSANAPDTATHLIAAFRRGLEEAGYSEGRNVIVEYRWAEGQNDRLPAIAAEFVRRNVSVIVPFGATTAEAARTATQTIPIVFMAGVDPVEVGLVASLNRPARNATGIAVFTSTLMPKRLEMLHEAVPAARRVTMLANPTNTSMPAQVRDVQDAAHGFGVDVDVVDVTTENEIETAFAALGSRGAGAVLFGADQLFQVLRDRLIALAARHAVPAIYEYREFADAGGLMSFGPDRAEAFRLLGRYTGRVLGGASPAELPVVQSARFELVVNLRTARTLGLAIPPALLARADDVLE
jgi:putative ABC transport system substrate-binding protein